MLKQDYELNYKIKYHEARLAEALSTVDPDSLREIQKQKFFVTKFKRQERLRIASLPWANAGQILHDEYKREWTISELEEMNEDFQ